MKGLLIPILLSGFCQAVRVYLHPAPSFPPRLSASHAGAALSSHLSLERFEDATIYSTGQELLVGSGLDTGLLLTMSEEDAKDIIPSSLRKSSFSFSSTPTPDSFSALVPTYIDRAHHVYSLVYETSAPASRLVDSLKDFLNGEFPVDRFAAFDFTALSVLKQHLGSDADEVREAYTSLRDTLSAVAARSDVKLAIVSVPAANTLARRQPPQSPLPPPLPHPAEPIDSISTCYSSADTCANATSTCSGHGECVAASKAGKTCFVCACAATKDAKGRKELWAGNACERQDVSGPFVLLAGTTVALLLLVGGSVGLLTGIGSDKLPSTLSGGGAHGSR